MKLTGRITWEWEAGDGTECFHCGDAAWLKQSRMVIVWDTGGQYKPDIVLCASCANEKLEQYA